MGATPYTSIQPQPARIVYSGCAFPYSSYSDTSLDAIEALKEQVETDAFRIARREGYKRMDVTTYWTPLRDEDIATPYRAPQTLRECWALSYRDNPVARYVVIIRDMDCSRYIEASRSST